MSREWDQVRNPNDGVTREAFEKKEYSLHEQDEDCPHVAVKLIRPATTRLPWRTYMFARACVYVCMYVHKQDWISHDKLMNYLQLGHTMINVSVGITVPISAGKKKVHLESYYYYNASLTKLSSQSSATSRRAYSTKPSFQSVPQGLQCNQCNRSG
jgi:hypothetical protein